MKSIRNMMKINMTSRICISSLISLTVQLCFSFHGKKIVGVSCTTDYAHLCLLSAATDPSKNNQFFYFCNCYGHHGIGRVFSQCLMHYWECPLTEWTHEPNPFVTRAHAAPKPLALFNHYYLPPCICAISFKQRKIFCHYFILFLVPLP